MKKGREWPYVIAQWTAAGPISLFLTITFAALFARRSLLGHVRIHRKTADRDRVSCWITAKAKVTLDYVLVS